MDKANLFIQGIVKQVRLWIEEYKSGGEIDRLSDLVDDVRARALSECPSPNLLPSYIIAIALWEVHHERQWLQDLSEKSQEEDK